MRRVLAVVLIVFGVLAIIGGVIMLYSLKGSSDNKVYYLQVPATQATNAIIQEG